MQEKYGLCTEKHCENSVEKFQKLLDEIKIANYECIQ